MRWLVFVLGCVGCRLHFDDACTPVPGLVAYFPMEQDDIVGNTLRDHLGKAHDGAIFGTPAPVLSPGQVDDALDFAATATAYVDISGLALDTTTGTAATVAGWFHSSDPSPNTVLSVGPRGRDLS